MVVKQLKVEASTSQIDEEFQDMVDLAQEANSHCYSSQQVARFQPAHQVRSQRETYHTCRTWTTRGKWNQTQNWNMELQVKWFSILKLLIWAREGAYIIA